MDIESYRSAGADLIGRLHLPTGPVAIKYIKSEDEIPEQAVRPSALNQKWSLCQALTYARRWGRHSAMTEKDNFCVPSSAMHQWVEVSPEDFIESQVVQGWHRDLASEQMRYALVISVFAGEAGQAMLKQVKQYIGFVCSPLADTIVQPDAIVIYGDGTHVMHLIHALTFDYTLPLISSFEGFGEGCIKAGLVPFITGRPQILIPGMGDRGFAGIHDHEIGISFPATMLSAVQENLFKSGGPQNAGQPIKTLLPTDLTESLTPGFAFLREKLDKKDKG
jgi:uncharacterized protein (DUF169 family)